MRRHTINNLQLSPSAPIILVLSLDGNSSVDRVEPLPRLRRSLQRRPVNEETNTLRLPEEAKVQLKGSEVGTIKAGANAVAPDPLAMPLQHVA